MGSGSAKSFSFPIWRPPRAEKREPKEPFAPRGQGGGLCSTNLFIVLFGHGSLVSSRQWHKDVPDEGIKRWVKGRTHSFELSLKTSSELKGPQEETGFAAGFSLAPTPGQISCSISNKTTKFWSAHPSFLPPN